MCPESNLVTTLRIQLPAPVRGPDHWANPVTRKRVSRDLLYRSRLRPIGGRDFPHFYGIFELIYG